MPTRFVALPVSTGDAFYLERGDFAALVDGGLATGFPGLFMRMLSRTSVNVLVCTHNDADHANGILEFLRAGYQADECWLPATWLEALATLLTVDPFDVVDQLSNSDEADSAEESPHGPAEQDGEVIHSEAVEQLLDSRASEDPMFDSVPFVDPCLLGGDRSRRHAPGVVPVSRLMADAARIQAIAVEATRRQIPIKWFDPDRMPASASGPLHVVNAASVQSVQRRRLSPRDVLDLTRVNRQSLVLYSPPDDIAPGVLFSADSGFGFSAPLPASHGMIVTAPHHGSADQENVFAYGRLIGAHHDLSPSWIWVRSDRAKRPGSSRPCDAYLEQPRRYCTRCRGGPRRGQCVVLDGVSASWSTSASPCGCSQT